MLFRMREIRLEARSYALELSLQMREANPSGSRAFRREGPGERASQKLDIIIFHRLQRVAACDPHMSPLTRKLRMLPNAYRVNMHYDLLM